MRNFYNFIFTIEQRKYIAKHTLQIMIIVATLFTFILISCNEDPPVSAYFETDEIDAQVEAELNVLNEIEIDVNNSLAKKSRHHRHIELPAGSVDALADAIERAGRGGTVFVREGLHIESGTVTVSKKVKIVGEKGAVFEFDTKPEPIAGKINPAIHILNTSEVRIWGIEINPKDAIGGTGILVENSDKCVLAKNKLYNHQYGILNERGNHTTIWKNRIETNSAWQTGDLAFAIGVVNINGKKTSILENDLSNGFLGAFACDEKGLFYANYMHANYIGILVCKVPENNFTFPDGHMVGAEVSGTRWKIKHNRAEDNIDTGYLVIDGANKNLLKHNYATNNGKYDIELAGESERFGFYTPTSFENKVIIKNPNMIVKDCGMDNIVRGGTLVYNSIDPCY